MPQSRVVPRRGRALVAAGVVAAALLGGCASAGNGGTASATRPARSAVPHDWRNATYHLNCDGLVAREMTAKLVNGAAKVPSTASENRSYDYFDIRLEAEATGDVDGDGQPDAVVLLKCSPQPSNAFVEEVHVFRADGSELGALPSPQTLKETTILAPLYVPNGLSVQHEDVVAEMKAYGPGDSHATGPSVLFTVRWHWNGTEFVRVR
jgi:hypothetical protein